MDHNNNNNRLRNPNQFRGRAVPPQERAGQVRQCRRCLDWFVNILRHEKNCTGFAKPYFCQICQRGYLKEYLVRRHFEVAHPNNPVPPDFLNPEFRHRRANQGAQGPAPPQQQQAAQDANPPQGGQNVAAGGQPEEPVAGPAPPPVPPVAQPAAGGEGPAPAAPAAAGVGGNGAVPAQAPAPPPQGGNGLPGAQLSALLRFNLAAILVSARDVLGDDLAVINLVCAILRDPAQFRIPG